MNNIVLANPLLNYDEILLIDIIEEFTNLKTSVNTQRSYRADLVQFFKQLNVTFLSDFAFIPFPSIVENVNLFLKNSTKKDPLTNRVFNPKTVNRKAYSISAFFNYLIHTYGYHKNPIKHFQPLKTQRRSTTTSLTRAEILDILEFAKGNHRKSETNFRNYLILIFLFALALRREEVANLKWDDVNFQNHTVNVYQK